MLSDVAAMDNATYGIQLDQDAILNQAGGTLYVGNNGTADCFTDAGAKVADGTCNAANGSAHAVINSLTSGASIRGSLANSVDYNLMTDWFSELTAPEGLFGQEGSAYPAADQRGPCTPGSTCTEFSYDYVNGDAILKDRLGGMHPDGNATMTRPYQAGSVTYLLGAREVFREEAVDHGIVIQPGNNNGLCESGESCVLAPNIGAYQGHDTLVRDAGSDIAGGGTIVNVEMWKYSTNGH